MISICAKPFIFSPMIIIMNARLHLMNINSSLKKKKGGGRGGREETIQRNPCISVLKHHNNSVIFKKKTTCMNFQCRRINKLTYHTMLFHTCTVCRGSIQNFWTYYVQCLIKEQHVITETFTEPTLTQQAARDLITSAFYITDMALEWKLIKNRGNPDRCLVTMEIEYTRIC